VPSQVISVCYTALVRHRSPLGAPGEEITVGHGGGTEDGGRWRDLGWLAWIYLPPNPITKSTFISRQTPPTANYRGRSTELINISNGSNVVIIRRRMLKTRCRHMTWSTPLAVVLSEDARRLSLLLPCPIDVHTPCTRTLSHLSRPEATPRIPRAKSIPVHRGKLAIQP
jgi:hypothetical protein